MEKEMCHILISLFLVQGRGGLGIYSFITTAIHALQFTRGYTSFITTAIHSYLKSLEFPM
jgi:hypothetical protein